MKKLQHNFTTPEQSKRLLELGVPIDSADCYWNDICGKPIPMQQGILYSDKRNQFRKVNVPVWSVGRLIEIFDICDISYISDEWPNTTTMTKRSGSVIEYIVGTYENAHNKKLLDFSKLED